MAGREWVEIAGLLELLFLALVRGFYRVMKGHRSVSLLLFTDLFIQPLQIQALRNRERERDGWMDGWMDG